MLYVIPTLLVILTNTTKSIYRGRAINILAAARSYDITLWKTSIRKETDCAFLTYSASAAPSHSSLSFYRITSKNFAIYFPKLLIVYAKNQKLRAWILTYVHIITVLIKSYQNRLLPFSGTVILVKIKSIPLLKQKLKKTKGRRQDQKNIWICISQGLQAIQREKSK